ncbi:hypothetical protein THAOC_22377, partial [Thalassiosira oceanica]
SQSGQIKIVPGSDIPSLSTHGCMTTLTPSAGRDEP